MRRGTRTAAEVFSSDGSHVDAHIRDAQSIRVEPRAVRDVARRLQAIREELETHFGWPLGVCEEPDFLVYSAGGFYRPHRDRPLRDGGAAHEAFNRAVSVVVFVNDARTVPDVFDGGALTFYGLGSSATRSGARPSSAPDPRWRDVGLPLQPQAGLLVAFDSSLLHEVAAVERGKRFTIVTWFPHRP